MNNSQKILNNFNEINKDTLSYPRSLIYMNIRSLRLNFTLFIATINNILNHIKVIILVETNITDNENKFYNIKGFNSIFFNREGRGGGIALYITEHIHFNQIHLNTNSLEIIQIDIEINNKTTSLLSIYRPPRENIPSFITELEKIINTIKKKQEIILVGDINIDISRENYTTTTYLNMLMSNGLECMINECTRVDVTKNSKTCIDHIFMRNNKTKRTVSAIITTSISDHYSLYFCVEEKKK